MSNLELVSVHIPKTGGISVRRVLERKYGKRLGLDYPPARTQGLANGLMSLPGRLRTRLQARSMRCVHGHFPARKYAAGAAEMMVFVRDPIELRASTWHYVRREHARQGSRNPDWESAMTMEIEEFILTQSRTYREYLGQVPMHRFAFVGTIEHFDQDLARLCERLGVAHRPVRENSNPAGSDYNLDSGIKHRFRQENPQEYELYEAALQRRDELLCKVAA